MSMTLLVLFWLYHQLNLPRGIEREKMTFWVLNQIADIDHSLTRGKERVGGLVSGFINASCLCGLILGLSTLCKLLLQSLPVRCQILPAVGHPPTVWH